ncbi:hypothetical protein BJ741DRAFT_590661 [Chytriomyces cf. hyalinus JEL632]|nr:hypothetical protein BJ741DRAFT_590661 [Chytriomyces cf. hyalinus JEL632]
MTLSRDAAADTRQAIASFLSKNSNFPELALPAYIAHRPPTPPRPRHGISFSNTNNNNSNNNSNSTNNNTNSNMNTASPTPSCSSLIATSSSCLSRSNSISAASSTSSVRSVSFSTAPCSLAFTHAAGEYDRTCIEIDPLSGKDVAALFMFRLSLPGFTAMKPLEAASVRRASITAANRDLAAAVYLEQQQQQQVFMKRGNEYEVLGSKHEHLEDVDWISALARDSRASCAIAMDETSWAGVWDRVDQCSFQLLRI